MRAVVTNSLTESQFFLKECLSRMIWGLGKENMSGGSQGMCLYPWLIFNVTSTHQITWAHQGSLTAQCEVTGDWLALLDTGSQQNPGPLSLLTVNSYMFLVTEFLSRSPHETYCAQYPPMTRHTWLYQSYCDISPEQLLFRLSPRTSWLVLEDASPLFVAVIDNPLKDYYCGEIINLYASFHPAAYLA